MKLSHISVSEMVLSFFLLKATASVTPQHWQPNSGLLMANDVPENPEGSVPCIALSKNDSYVMSACGGKVSLFNMMTFKVSSSLFQLLFLLGTWHVRKHAS